MFPNDFFHKLNLNRRCLPSRDFEWRNLFSNSFKWCHHDILSSWRLLITVGMNFYSLFRDIFRKKSEKGILAFSEIMFNQYEVEYNQSYVVQDGIQLKSVNLEPGFQMFYHKGYILYTSEYFESNDWDYLLRLLIIIMIL